MTDRHIELTRRKVLAGLGTVGLASAGAGLGTTAYFSDEETFENNTLTAGSLDLQVDWEEHYFDNAEGLNDDRTDDIGGEEFDTDLDGDGVDDFEIVRTGGDPGAVPDGYVGFPTFDEPMVAVPDAAMDDFLDNTAVEALPDENDDGIQDVIYTRNQIATMNPTLSPAEVEAEFHAQFADVPDDLERPVIELEDVKPGDFGEVTFSTHLHDNPGYLWLTGELLEATENGLTEPERKDPDEDQTLDDDGNVVLKDGEEDATVELLDEIQAAIWYDDGDNVREETEMIRSPHDVADPTNITLDAESSLVTRGSLREVLEALADGLGIELDADATTPDRVCYPNSSTYYFGFAWWVPVDHANEIQTDSVTFDLGFYTEQCRHNDGSGMPPTRRFTSDEIQNRNTAEQIPVADIEGAEPIVATVTDADPVVLEIEPALPMDAGGDQNATMSVAFDPEADGGAWDFQLTWTFSDGFEYIENNPVTTEPDLSNVTGVAADYDSSADVFTIEIVRSRLTAGGDDYRFAFQTIDDTSGTVPKRIDAELPTGFTFGDSSTWLTDTLQ